MKLTLKMFKSLHEAEIDKELFKKLDMDVKDETALKKKYQKE